MTIEIHEPKVEAPLQKWMESGCFSSAEQAIGIALENAPVPQDFVQSTPGVQVQISLPPSGMPLSGVYAGA